MVEKNNIHFHFFKFKELDPSTNYGQVFTRTEDIGNLYQSILDNNVKIHLNGTLQTKSWAHKEFALIDPESNLLIFG
jgi:hypothetical protein